jgi:hypothetical protein
VKREKPSRNSASSVALTAVLSVSGIGRGFAKVVDVEVRRSRERVLRNSGREFSHRLDEGQEEFGFLGRLERCDEMGMRG